MSRMVVNSYILYSENVKPSIRPPQKPMTRYRFTELIVDAIGKEWLERKPERQAPANKKSKTVGVIRLEGTKLRLCGVCSTEAKKCRSHFVCASCEKGLHPTCISGHKC